MIEKSDDNSFRKAFHHLKLSLIYFEDTLRSMPNQLAGAISKTAASKINWIFLNFKSNPNFTRESIDEFDREINTDPMVLESVPELWHKLNIEQKGVLENILVMVISGEKVTVILNENKQ